MQWFSFRYEKLKVMLDQKLEEFYQLSIYWPKELRESYDRLGWKKAQIDVDSFIERILKSDSDLLKILKHLRNFSESQELSEEYGIMKNIVYICCRLIDNVKVIDYYSTVAQ